MMLPLNPLYEVVPVTKETMPQKLQMVTVITNYNLWYRSFVDSNGEWWNRDKSELLYKDEAITHYLRPLPPERMEEMVMEIVGKAWDVSAETERAGTIINVTQKQTFIDNLINDMSK